MHFTVQYGVSLKVTTMPIHLLKGWCFCFTRPYSITTWSFHINYAAREKRQYKGSLPSIYIILLIAPVVLSNSNRTHILWYSMNLLLKPQTGIFRKWLRVWRIICFDECLITISSFNRRSIELYDATKHRHPTQAPSYCILRDNRTALNSTLVKYQGAVRTKSIRIPRFYSATCHAHHHAQQTERKLQAFDKCQLQYYEYNKSI